MLNPSCIINLGGTDYKVTPPNLLTEDAFQDYLKRYVVAEAVRMRDSYGPAFADAVKGVHEDVATGAYDWLSDNFFKAIMSDKHMMKLAELTISQETPIAADVLRKHWRDGGETLEKDGEKYPVTKGQFLFKTIMEYITRPNSQGPAQQ